MGAFSQGLQNDDGLGRPKICNDGLDWVQNHHQHPSLPPHPYHQLLFCFIYAVVLLFLGLHNLHFRLCNFHVLGSVGSNHSSCRNVIPSFVENGDFCEDLSMRERERKKKRKRLPLVYGVVSTTRHGTTQLLVATCVCF